jgi:hypothetical protein
MDFGISQKTGAKEGDKNMKEEEKSFKVTDRRRFASEASESAGDAKESETRRAPETKAADAETAEKKPMEHEKPHKKDTAAEARLPEINFSTFILSLNSSALVQLGLIEDPVTGEMDKNLPIAKQTIDILGMLDEKTKGNLTVDESMMLKNMLYDLRMLYVREKS